LLRTPGRFVEGFGGISATFTSQNTFLQSKKEQLEALCSLWPELIRPSAAGRVCSQDNWKWFEFIGQSVPTKPIFVEGVGINKVAPKVEQPEMNAESDKAACLASHQT